MFLKEPETLSEDILTGFFLIISLFLTCDNRQPSDQGKKYDGSFIPPDTH